MSGKTKCCALVFVGLMVMATVSQAKMTMVKPYVFTGNTPLRQTLDVSIEVFSNNASHPPNYVQSIDLVLPSGATIPIDPVDAWDEELKQYFVSFLSADFGGAIPSGTYKVTVRDAAGSITIPDAVTATFLPIPVVTFPTVGAVVTNSAPTFTWKAVAGARFYRIHLYDAFENRWIYSNVAGHLLETTGTSIQIQSGVLKTGRLYRMRVEARYDFPDMDKRSRNDWVNFNTAW